MSIVHCCWHDGDVPDHQAQEIRPGEYACNPCIQAHGLIPLHLVRPAFVGHPDAVPELPTRPG